MIVIVILCSLMLIGLVLLQKSKGGGLGTTFGGGGDGSMFGSRTGNVLTRATVVLGVAFLLTTLILNTMFSYKKGELSSVDKELMKGIITETRAATAAKPGKIPAVPAPADEMPSTLGGTVAPEESGTIAVPSEAVETPVAVPTDAPAGS